MDTLVRTTIADGVATVTLDRPEARNALSLEVIEALESALDRVEAVADLRAFILSGAGKAFCAGMDVMGVMADPVRMRRMLHGLARVCSRIRRLAAPTLSRVQGAAVGGGCGLMVVTDFAVTHPEAKVGYPEVALGLCPAVVAPWLIRRVGAGRARFLLLSGGTVSGVEAERLGLVSHLVARSDLEAETDRIVADLVSGGGEAMVTTKGWLNELDGSLDEEQGLRGAELSADVIEGPEAQRRLRERFGNP